MGCCVSLYSKSHRCPVQVDIQDQGSQWVGITAPKFLVQMRHRLRSAPTPTTTCPLGNGWRHRLAQCIRTFHVQNSTRGPWAERKEMNEDEEEAEEERGEGGTRCLYPHAQITPGPCQGKRGSRQHAKGRSEIWTFELVRILILATEGQLWKFQKKKKKIGLL